MRGKTVWDWLQLLVVPLMLALITVVFTWQQNVRQNELEDQRTRQAQKIEDQRAEAERKLAEQRAQDEALQAYLTQMSSLLLEKDLRSSEEDSEVGTLARARTLTVLERLDPSRKADVMQFLVEAELIQRVDGREPIINLSGANLSKADLSGADLRKTNLNVFADLSEADLSTTDLSKANLSNAYLTGANLDVRDLSKANLSNAYLGPYRAGDYREGRIIEKLEQRAGADSLEGAIMPNGQKYEEWLKSKGRGEGGGESGPQ